MKRLNILTAALLLMVTASNAQYLDVSNEQGTFHIDVTQIQEITYPKVNGVRQMSVNFKDGSDWTTPVATIGEMKPKEEKPEVTYKTIYVKNVYLDQTESQPMQLRPFFGKDGTYHFLTFIPKDATVYYSYDGQSWTDTGMYNVFEGWVSIVMQGDASFAYNTWRTSLQVAVDGSPSDQTTAVLTPPLNAEGWWASPVFNQKTTVYGEMMTAVGKEPFTVMDGKVFWLGQPDKTVDELQLSATHAAGKGLKVPAGKQLLINFTTGEARVAEVGEYLAAPRFRTYNTVHTDENNCSAQGNTVHLVWDAVPGASYYEIKMAYPTKVSAGGAEVWENADNVLLSTQVAGTEYDLTGLDYGAEYRFAIRAVATNTETGQPERYSDWYGYGNGRNWYAYTSLQTGARYAVPTVVRLDRNTRNLLRVAIDLTYNAESDTYGYSDNFEIAEGKFVATSLVVKASPRNSNANVPEKWQHYQLTSEDLSNGYVDIEGLDENTEYYIDVVNDHVKSEPDARYNTIYVLTAGEVGDPVPIPHSVDPNDQTPGAVAQEACRIDEVLDNYATENKLAEGTIFELEGDKTYYIGSNLGLVKGFTLRTREADAQQGKRARVYMGGMDKDNVLASNFMLGRQMEAGESNAAIYVGEIVFEGIDFDCPNAKNYSEGSATGNYFINQYSNSMNLTIESVTIRDCTFQHMMRGFMRFQGANPCTLKHFLLENSLFYNCGYHSSNGRGYGWFYGDPSTNPKSNAYADFVVRNNTFYDSPLGYFITNNNRNLQWADDFKYDITVENNTFVNFNTRSASNYFFSMRYMPGGSKIAVKKNLFVQTKQDGDDRTMSLAGADVRTINGSGVASFDFADNYSTNTFLTNGQIFSGYAFSATNNSFGKWPNMNVSGADGLKVIVDDIAPTELMQNPNPPHTAAEAALMHHVDNLSGLKYNDTEKVKQSAIYKNGIGDQRWR